MGALEVTLIGAFLGLIVGSFISMLTWRLPRNLHLSSEQQFKLISIGRSKCPHCQTPLPWYRLFPLFSWFYSRGKCHNCKTPISIRYPIIEFSTLALTGLAAYLYGATPEGFAIIIFIWFLISITVIDIEHQLILDSLSLPLLWLGLLLNTQTMFTSLSQAVWGAALGYLLLWGLFHIFKLLTHKEGMGYGDFKLLAALGAWLGLEALPQIILIASVGSIVIALILALFKLRKLDKPIPFGPYLAVGGLISLLLGKNLLI